MTSTELIAVDPADVVLLGTPTISREEADEILELAARAVSDGTKRAYASSWRTWTAWCTARGHEPWCTTPEHAAVLGVWIKERAGSGIAMSTITKDLAAVSKEHLDAGQSDPTAARGVRQVMKGARQKYGIAPKRRAHALTTAEIRRVLAQIDRSTLRGKRDAAIILTGFAGAMRRSELAALTVGDLDFKARGAVVTLRKSKADQEGAGVPVGLPRGQHPETDPVGALRAWIAAASIEGADPLFQRIGRRATKVMDQGLSGAAISEILIERARAAGLEDEALHVTGHSLRAGHATQAAEAKVDVVRLARTTRHVRLETLAGYIRPAEVLHDSTANDLGL
ncbi:tyrosine-type recombinase/integrase [Cellulomonas sp. KRMCY2]|uniref:tyrosine-type recombinase/integrase n=1 Tax=Cellulomonas sp. KRMCY2 TaxID=1304865 RepID=UPI00045E7017|nr:tyrosine-type recombinase/integrase [Cellulomonas sp. KRMCY2]